MVADAEGSEVGRWPLPARILGAGKGAARMAVGCERVLGRRTPGAVVVADGCEVGLGAVECLSAGHPLPDSRGLSATDRIVEHAATVGPGEVCLFLLSGGASSLFVRPEPPVSLPDKIEVNRLLIGCGASIQEVNTVRKHLSAVKGGGLLRFCRGTVVGLILSDVPGDDLTAIGSGPTVPDPTTFGEALAIVRRYGLADRVPDSAIARLSDGCRGLVRETLKPHEPDARRATNVLVGSNPVALRAAAQAASQRGWDVETITAPLVGDSRVAAAAFARHLRRVERRREGRNRTTCVIAGGETTVEVTGTGKGGRNQEFALALVAPLAGMAAAVLSAGSDGIDGPTPAAGAFVDGNSARRARDRGLVVARAQEENDSYGFFREIGDLFSPGPTGTNVMDLKFAILP
jgi:hydroxypyruvate reductase